MCFPSVPQIDAERFPDPLAVAARLEGHGVATSVESHPDHVVRRAGDWVSAVEERFVSTLQLVPPSELEQGLDRFRRAFPDPDDRYEYTLQFLRISGTV